MKRTERELVAAGGGTGNTAAVAGVPSRWTGRPQDTRGLLLAAALRPDQHGEASAHSMAESIFLPGARGTFHKDMCRARKTGLDPFKRVEIAQDILPDHKGVTWEINNRKTSRKVSPISKSKQNICK